MQVWSNVYSIPGCLLTGPPRGHHNSQGHAIPEILFMLSLPYFDPVDGEVKEALIKSSVFLPATLSLHMP